jgi:hypothetical protein
MTQSITKSTSVPREKSPLVWLDMDQAELDDAYGQTAYAPMIAPTTLKRKWPAQRTGHFAKQLLENYSATSSTAGVAPSSFFFGRSRT